VHYTGTTTLRLYSVPPDVTDTIPPDGSNKTVSFTTPGQNGRLTFSGTANQRISLKVSSGPSGSFTVLKPDGTTLSSGSINLFGSFVDTQTLTSIGTHAIVLNPSEAETGSVTLNLYDVPADFNGSITPGGPSVTAPLTTPGQNGRLTFAGTANQRISLKVSGGPSGSIAILRPDDTTLVSGSSNIIPTFFEPQTLSTTDTYAITINPSGANAGDLIFTLYDVPPDVTGTLTLGGSSVPVTITTAGQNGTLTSRERLASRRPSA
jgi:hypothetical protein